MRQAQAMTVMMEGRSVFLTGAPGSGKSYVLSRFVQNAEKMGRKVAVTASTGIAATHIGGSTIHSWSGLGIRESLGSSDIAILSRRAPLVARYQTTDVLVIDEVSMLPNWFLDLLDRLAQAFRGDSRPFGGLQMILVGDMFQLPPVSRDSSASGFAYHASAWEDLDPAVCYLDEQHRQKNDGLLQILEAMRKGALGDDHLALLQDRMRHRPPSQVEATKLYSHNVNVDAINQKRLAELRGDSQLFEMRSRGSAALVEQLTKRVLAPKILELKLGAEVMFVANDPGRAYMNGTRGKVVRFDDGRPIVALAEGERQIGVVPYSWQNIEDEKVIAEVSQLPLRLAWAITIHKSQGMSIDAAQIDLSRSFTPGMGYVALSRLRSLEGLYITGLNSMALRLSSEIFELDEKLRASSAELARTTGDFDDLMPKPSDSAVARETPVPDISSGEDLLAALKAWRRRRAEAADLPDYIVAHNAQLEAIALTIPTDEDSLLAIRGMGRAKLATYGAEILTLTRAYAAARRGF